MRVDCALGKKGGNEDAGKVLLIATTKSEAVRELSRIKSSLSQRSFALAGSAEFSAPSSSLGFSLRQAASNSAAVNLPTTLSSTGAALGP